jgi:transposase InsO family protein
MFTVTPSLFLRRVRCWCGGCSTKARRSLRSRRRIDDYSRIAYVEILHDERGETCAAFLDRAITWFADRGVRLERVLTDNGPGYRSRTFTAASAHHQIRLLRTRSYRPRTNGKAERFIHTMLRAGPTPSATRPANKPGPHTVDRLLQPPTTLRRPQPQASGHTAASRLINVPGIYI